MSLVRRLVGALSLAGASMALAPATGAPAAAQPQAPAASSPGSAAPRIEQLTREVSSQLRCPVCQGESIQDSPSTLAQEMRAVVRSQLEAGRTPDEVRAYFVSKYGNWILLEPPARGFTGLVYILPLIALLTGAAIVTRSVRRWTASQTREGASGSADSDDANAGGSLHD